jgi:Glu-tRNA(Gln) amidotransferase subunit E-like FAD-binding protein
LQRELEEMENGESKVMSMYESEAVQIKPIKEEKKLKTIDEEEVKSIIENDIKESTVQDYKTKENLCKVMKPKEPKARTKVTKKSKEEEVFDLVEAIEKEDSDWDDFILL